MILSCLLLCVFFFFFFKQKTAYEMRISDWSSDVCSSDLALRGHRARQVRDRAVERGQRGRRRRADLDPKRRLLARIGGDLGGGDGAVVRHAAIARWQAADLDLATRRRRGAPRLLTPNTNPGIVADRKRTRLNSRPSCASHLPTSA